MYLFYYLWSAFIHFLSEFYHLLLITRKTLDIAYGFEEEEELMEDVLEPVKERYEDKYLSKFHALLQNQTQELPDNINKRFIIEMTPVGNVIMQYDVGKESFVYYTDNIIPFRYLETIARKYVCVFNCKELFIQRQEQKIVQTSKVSIKTKDLMNQARNPHLNEKEKEKQKTQIEVKMNRYSNAGRVGNFNILQPVAKHVTDKKRLLRFSDFKSNPSLMQKRT